MAARKILRLAVLIFLLVWDPGPAPEPTPRNGPRDGGSWLDVGLRFDPERPWTTWRIYVDLRRGTDDSPAEAPDEADAEAEPSPFLGLGVDDLARAAGGLRYSLLRGGLDSFRGPRERP